MFFGLRHDADKGFGETITMVKSMGPFTLKSSPSRRYPPLREPPDVLLRAHQAQLV